MIPPSTARLLEDRARWTRPYDGAGEYLEDELARAGLLLAARVGEGGEGAWLTTADGEVSAEAAAIRLAEGIAGRLEASEREPLAAVLPEGEVLTADERSVLAMAAAVELDPASVALLEQLEGRVVASGISVGVLARVLSEDLASRVAVMRETLGPEGALRRLGLLRGPFGDAAGSDQLRLRVSRAVLAALVGFVPDVGVDAVSAVRRPGPVEAAMTFPAAVLDPLWRFYPDTARDEAPYWPIVLVTGPVGVGKTALVDHVAACLGFSVRELMSDRAAAGTKPLGDLLSRVVEGAVANREVVHLDAAALLGGREAAGRHELRRVLERREAPVFLEARSQGELDPRVLDVVDVVCRLHALTGAERRGILAQPPRGVGGPPEDARSLLAQGLALNARGLSKAMRLAGQVATYRDPEAPALDPGELAAAARMQLHGDLSELAERRERGPTMEDLVLPEEAHEHIVEVIDACKARARVLSEWGFGERLSKGRGSCLLFHGEPGTGKTHCAEVLAAELGLELYQVSLPRIVSKWVGETERNIDRIFAAARMSRAVLLFDEADSLFANRTEVRSANDRYANMETNYLLQQIEHYDGVVILTTNFVKNLDSAAERRIAYRVEFPFPDAAARASIWRTLLPEAAPVADDVDFAELGESYELSGGYIKNAVMRAACRAMAAGTILTADALGQAAETECRLAGRMVRHAPKPKPR